MKTARNVPRPISGAPKYILIKLNMVIGAALRDSI